MLIAVFPYFMHLRVLKVEKNVHFLLLRLTKQLLSVKFCDKTAGIGIMAGQVPRKCQDIAGWTDRRA